MKTKDALILTGLQNDFFSGGEIEIKNAEKLIPVINEELLPKFDLIIFSLNWRQYNMINSETYQREHFNKKAYDIYINDKNKKDIVWPDFCIANTSGADIYHGVNLEKCKSNFYFFKKNLTAQNTSYSAFSDVDTEINQNELLNFLHEKGITNLYIAGMPLEYDIKATALDAIFLGFNVYVFDELCIPLHEEPQVTYKVLSDAGVKYI